VGSEVGVEVGGGLGSRECVGRVEGNGVGAREGAGVGGGAGTVNVSEVLEVKTQSEDPKRVEPSMYSSQ
jgi:hypothetical protein